MVVKISTIDEVRDMLVKLNINERDVHKVLTSLQMRDNWLQYLSQKMTPEEMIHDGLDEMIRQHSDPPSDRKQQEAFLGEKYIPYRRNTSSNSSSSSVHRRETHVCDTLGPNPKVMIAHLGTRDLNNPPSPESPAPKGVSKYYEESDEEEQAAQPLSPVRDVSSHHSAETSSSYHEQPPTYQVVDVVKPVSPNFCVRVLTAPLNKRVLPTSGLKFFNKSCAARAQQPLVS